MKKKFSKFHRNILKASKYWEPFDTAIKVLSKNIKHKQISDIEDIEDLGLKFRIILLNHCKFEKYLWQKIHPNRGDKIIKSYSLLDDVLPVPSVLPTKNKYTDRSSFLKDLKIYYDASMGLKNKEHVFHHIVLSPELIVYKKLIEAIATKAKDIKENVLKCNIKFNEENKHKAVRLCEGIIKLYKDYENNKIKLLMMIDNHTTNSDVNKYYSEIILKSIKNTLGYKYLKRKHFTDYKGLGLGSYIDGNFEPSNLDGDVFEGILRSIKTFKDNKHHNINDWVIRKSDNIIKETVEKEYKRRYYEQGLNEESEVGEVEEDDKYKIRDIKNEMFCGNLSLRDVSRKTKYPLSTLKRWKKKGLLKGIIFENKYLLGKDLYKLKEISNKCVQRIEHIKKGQVSLKILALEVGKSKKTIERRIKDGKIPKPHTDKYTKVRYYYRNEINKIEKLLQI